MKSIFLTLIGCLFLSVSAIANTGVAFVHGTGKQTNALKDYWTRDFVDSVRRGIPNSSNYVVINCDFGQYMWDSRAAGCLAGQLVSFIDSKRITSLEIITHSNGGNVVRWILSNPTRDSRFPKVIRATKRVTALAPSSLGTPLANASIEGNGFEKSVGWLLGYKSDAVRMQQTHQMKIYNKNNLYGTSGRPALPKPFRVVIGTDVETNPFDGDSYCGGYQYNLGLEVTQNWLDSCSDGFLNCSSQAGAGTVWKYDYQFTKGREPLSHNQSRRKCFRLDTLLRNNI